ncbi:hypothetical protein FEM48_Zijuj07G0160300 [Ziziphus jujuba var. spinosa]|uniref:Leucine-rich repeat-containing N-terminal plant-type domain-containing protein n=1 Tax=Ziziphus jujuba var. spinosa TaxID=714518 RepID=A0A978V5K8_ZIZJJ|nr:hypothetical protein FEM48_Zijuj07G0160300 [Ziziphus jujuba var. spinosa]
MFASLAIKSKIQLPSSSPILSSWNPSNTSFCNWVGVTCSLLHQRVSALNMSYMNIHGTISPHTGNLSFLRTLNLGSNSFRGPIPETIGKLRLRRLRKLNLRDNQLEGSMPSTINGQSLSSLEKLVLQYNNLVGTIPSSVVNISTLKVIALSYNGISRGIPNDMCRMLPKLETLYLLVNPLGGHIPTSLCLCRNLKELKLRENGLTGSIPTNIGCFSEIEYLRIPINQLTGTIPISLELPCSCFPKLSGIYFRPNQLNGRIPDFISNASMLTILELSNNSFSGPVPMTLGNLRKYSTNVIQSEDVAAIDLSNNAFQGNIPASIGDLASLESLDLSSNNLSGIRPKFLDKFHYLTYLNLSFNMLNGPVPVNRAFANFTHQSFMGNPDLCGNSKLKLPPWPNRTPSKSRKAMFCNCCCDTCGIIDNSVYQKEKKQKSTIL